jgi:hypothetical protein
MDYMVSSFDLKNLLGDDLKIINFSDLKNYKNIYELLPRQKDYCIIFYTDDMKNGIMIGHWTCLLRYNDYFEFFDSYGLTVSQELKFLSNEKRQRYGEETDYLENLLDPVKHNYNHFDYQKWDDNTTTCGRWVIIRIYLFNEGIITQKDFYNYLKKKVKKFGGNYDKLSVFYTE